MNETQTLYLSNSKFKEYIGIVFNYSFDFDFLDIVARVLDNLDNPMTADYEDIELATDCMYNYEYWTIIQHYQTPFNPNIIKALDYFRKDVLKTLELYKGDNK